MKKDDAPDTVRSTPSPGVTEHPPSVVVKKKVRLRTKTHTRRTNAEIIDEIERLQGRIDPGGTMFVVRMYRALERTNRAQAEVIKKLGAELRAARRKTR